MSHSSRTSSSTWTPCSRTHSTTLESLTSSSSKSQAGTRKYIITILVLTPKSSSYHRSTLSTRDSRDSRRAAEPWCPTRTSTNHTRQMYQARCPPLKRCRCKPKEECWIVHKGFQITVSSLSILTGLKSTRTIGRTTEWVANATNRQFTLLTQRHPSQIRFITWSKPSIHTPTANIQIRWTD